MRFLVDENLSPRLADFLGNAGHHAVHVRDLGLQRASDEEVLERAAADGAVVVSEDTDFGAIPARRATARPSLILLRSADPLTASQQADLILTELPLVHDALVSGAVLVIGRGRARLRSLPIAGEE